MAKYIIDIDTDHPLKDETGRMVYRAEKFASLVFDDAGMERLEQIGMKPEEEPLMAGDFVTYQGLFGRNYGVVLQTSIASGTVFVFTENGNINESEISLVKRTGAHTTAVVELMRCVAGERKMKSK